MKLVITGDSITANLGLKDPKQGYASIVSSKLGCTLGVDAINSAVSGYTSKDILEKIDILILNHRPKHCMIMVGTNDFRMDSINGVNSNTSYANYLNNIQGIYNKLVINNIQGTFISSIPSLVAGEQLRSTVYSDQLFGFCTHTGVNFINANAGFLYYLNNRSSQEFSSWYYDVYHPNEIGHSILAYFILKTQINL